MLLHHAFIRAARARPRKLFIADRSLGRRLTFRKALISVFALSRKLRIDAGSEESHLLGIMLLLGRYTGYRLSELARFKVLTGKQP